MVASPRRSVPRKSVVSAPVPLPIGNLDTQDPFQPPPERGRDAHFVVQGLDGGSSGRRSVPDGINRRPRLMKAFTLPM
jgi:hypothetical protein